MQLMLRAFPDGIVAGELLKPRIVFAQLHGGGPRTIRRTFLIREDLILFAKQPQLNIAVGQ